MKDNSIKIRFGEKETGWARKIGSKLARINNIPLTDGLNLWDTVELVDGGKDDLPMALPENVVDSVFDSKAVVFYKEDWQFHRFAAIFRMIGAHIEGIAGPKEGKDGCMFVAYSSGSGIDPRKLAEGLGVKQPKEK